jgi:hypothetical protein
MLSEDLKTTLLSRLKGFNTEPLFRLMDESDVSYHKTSLRGPLGMATIDAIHIDVDRIYNDRMLYFIILHETSHYKRIQKFGVKKIIENLSNEDFEKFFQFLLNEELVSDRYGCLLYYKFNKQEYPKSLTQELTNEMNKISFRQSARYIFGRVQNSEERFDEYMNSFIVN